MQGGIDVRGLVGNLDQTTLHVWMKDGKQPNPRNMAVKLFVLIGNK